MRNERAGLRHLDRGGATREPQETNAPPVTAVMRQDVPFVGPDADVEVVRRLFDESDLDVPCVAVVGPLGELQGIIHRRDAMPLAARLEHEELPDAIDDEGFHLDPQQPTAAGGLASPRFVAVPPGASVEVAAALMAYEGISWLPVVDEYHRLVGMVLAAEIMRWLACEASTRAFRAAL